MAFMHRPNPRTHASALEFLTSMLKAKKKLPAILQESNGEGVLRKEAQDVGEEMFGTNDLKQLAEEMIEIMRKAPGVGLAAPQIGRSLKIIVLEDKTEYMTLQSEQMREKLQRKPFDPVVICNPQLRPVGQKGFRYWEGCLSVRGFQGLVDRYVTVEVTGFDVSGSPMSFQATGWQARILQHEADHLHGTLYIDRAVPESVLKGRPPEGFNIPMGSRQCTHPLR